MSEVDFPILTGSLFQTEILLKFDTNHLMGRKKGDFGGSSSSNARGSQRDDGPALAGLVFSMGFGRISVRGKSRSG